MLHVWLIPALVILLLVLVGFYLIIRFKGGSGVRTEGAPWWINLMTRIRPSSDFRNQLI